MPINVLISRPFYEVDAMDLSRAPALFGLNRGKTLEIVVHGVCGMIIRDEEVTPEVGDMRILTRSTLKPWQFLALDLFDEDDIWILGMASTAGQELHVNRLKQFRDKLGGDTESLVIPAIFPSDSKHRAQCLAEGRPKSRLYHFCCGKHLMMQYACKKYGYPTDGYWHQDHPLQLKIKSFFEHEIGQKVGWEVDGCSLPTASTTTSALLRLWDKMGRATDSRTMLMKKLWGDNPVMVGGDETLDTAFMKITDGRIIAKEGADGIMIMQSRVELGEEPFTMLVKLSHGNFKPHMTIAFWAGLNRFREKLSSSASKILAYLDDKMPSVIDSKQQFVDPRRFP
jgi:L-asparaginase II